MARDCSAAVMMGTGTAPWTGCPLSNGCNPLRGSPGSDRLRYACSGLERADANVLVEAQVIAHEVLEDGTNGAAH